MFEKFNKMSKFYNIVAKKYFSGFFFLGGGRRDVPPCPPPHRPPISYAYDKDLTATTCKSAKGTRQKAKATR